jgi:superfamily I DNA/RNA helicase
VTKPFGWTDEQKTIIEPAQWGHTIISACAGSGKSTTIVERCIQHTQRIQPWQSIALISFTNKSAQDLREKLQAKGSTYSQIESSTFHAFLKKHVLGFDERFRGKKLPFTYSDKQSSLVNWLNYFVQNGKIPFATNARDDFLFEHALSLIQSKPQLKRYLQAKFHAVYIDEAQDNNHLQYDIVDELMKLGIECVLIGDSNQTIFGFRGAGPLKFTALSNDERFTRSGGVFHLSINHRCNAQIDFWANQTTEPVKNSV